MSTSTSGVNPKVESSQVEIPECEWHTQDPLTGELFFLSKGVLYSQFPQKEKQKIISINPTEKIDIQKRIPTQKNPNLYTLQIQQNFLVYIRGIKFKSSAEIPLRILLHRVRDI